MIQVDLEKILASVNDFVKYDRNVDFIGRLLDNAPLKYNDFDKTISDSTGIVYLNTGSWKENIYEWHGDLVGNIVLAILNEIIGQESFKTGVKEILDRKKSELDKYHEGLDNEKKAAIQNSQTKIEKVEDAKIEGAAESQEVNDKDVKKRGRGRPRKNT